MFPKVQEEQKKEYRPTQADDVETIVGPSVHVEGDFASEGNIVVKGMVSGNMKTSKLLTVEQGAKIFANIKANEAIISGQIKGNLKIEGRLELTESAQILGDIWCEVLSVSPGALIHGKISMKGIAVEGEKTTKRRASSRGRVKTEVQGEE